MTSAVSTAEPPPATGRWVQLCVGVLCMMLIANLQYAWTLFVNPMHTAHGWNVAGIQWAFSIFIATETWLTPIAGIFVDRLGPARGPRAMVAFGGILVGLGWVINAYADSLPLLYAGGAISGTGAGAIYATCVGNAVKWFPDRRGLAVGLTAAGFGAGAAATVIPIRMLIAARGYDTAFLWFGLGQGLLLLLVSSVLRGPDPTIALPPAPSSLVKRSARNFTSRQMLTTPVFWLLYVMFVMVSASGLIATAQIAPIAKDFGISNTAIFFGASTLSVALVVDNVLNGLARPFFGAVSDRLGRETTMAIAFTLGAGSYWLLATAGHNPWTFVACAGLIFFTWGEIFSLFPSTCTDTFGAKYSTANVALLYTAKGTSVFLVPLANVLRGASGDWSTVFLVTAAANMLVVLLALAVLRPMRHRLMSRGAAMLPVEALSAEPEPPPAEIGEPVAIWARAMDETGPFDPDLLNAIERELATHIGPIARPVVRKAAESSATLEALYARVADKIDDPDDRERFLAEAGGGQRRRAPFSLPSEQIERAERALTEQIGPIARMLVKRALGEIQSEAMLWERLAVHIDSPTDREEFLRRRSAI